MNAPAQMPAEGQDTVDLAGIFEDSRVKEVLDQRTVNSYALSP